ncbi:hypothetical protein ACLKA6_009879 [Drosophila palustris]
MKLRTTVQISSAIQKKPPLKREDSFLKRFSTRQIPETQETVEDTGSESASGDVDKTVKRRRRYLQKRRSVVNPDENFYFYWLMMLTICVLYNLWTLIVRQSFPELQVYDDRKLACHYVHSRDFIFDMIALIPLDLLQLKMGTHPLLRFTRFFKGDWVYPYRPGDYATLTRKYLGSLYWSTLTLTTIGDLPTPETNAEYIFTIVSYLIGVFIFATIVGQVGNVITNRNANRLEFERLLDGAKTYMRHHKVPGGMKRRVLRWYDYSWSRGRIQGGGDINTALGLLPDKLKTELALHVNLSVLKKVTIFQECQPEFLHDLVLKMKAYIFTPGDSICRKGEVAREMFIIADGILEVLSETGKVLTTMKAGDFFGEIGILNLDGLNKRTADVRSVGYSELFSLSREDVLAAMKDYPDAQEILQTLGRKRLMEVRCVNKKYAKIQSDKENAAYAAAHPNHPHPHPHPHPHAHPHVHGQHHHQVHQSDSSENSASKKIVDKLKHDVKGFRNVLKKSRTSRKSDESMEMQPLHITSPRSSKIMLKRMSRVRSDEKDADSADAKDELHDKTPSPIGAGLPLLQRLRLLKEKQDREERAVKSTPPQKSPPHSHVTCTLSPQESIQEEPEREFNEGFPLIQRLQQLKIKNEPQTNASSETCSVVMTNTPPNISSKVDFGLSEAGGGAGAGAGTSGTGGQSLTVVAQVKPIMKVSFKQRIQGLQAAAAGGSTAATAMNTGAITKKEPPKSLPVVAQHRQPTAITTLSEAAGGSLSIGGLPPISTISRKVIKPSRKLNTPMQSDTDTDGTPIKPWSKLKLATLMSSSYTSLTNCSPDADADLDTPVKNYSLSNIPQLMDGGTATGLTMGGRPRHHSARSARSPRHGHSYSHGHGHGHASSSSTCSSSIQSTVSTARECLRLNKPEQKLPEGAGVAANGERKFYQSVFDLSPEYCGLPFVKRLKILNERQKLAELEKALQTRSFSLDCSKSTSNNNEVPITESLYRCYSDTSGIYSQFLSTYESTTSSTSISTNTSASASASASASDGNYQKLQGQQKQLQQLEYMPLSPESNETVERRKLKSILKKLHKEAGDGDGAGDGHGVGDGDGAQDEAKASALTRGLLTEPTLEGPPASAKEEGHYAALGGGGGRGNLTSIALSNNNKLATVGNGNGNGNSSGNDMETGTGTGTYPSRSTFITASDPSGSVWSPTLALVTPTNSPQESFAFEPQLGGVIAGVGSASTSSASAAALAAASASTSYVVECSAMSSSNKILSQNTEFHAQSTTSTDLNLNLQLRQNTRNSLSGGEGQVPKLEGFPEAQDYFNQILSGINQVIKTHMNEMHSKFETQFSSMAGEVRRRDAIIAQLQLKLRTIEQKSTAASSSRRLKREKLSQISVDDDEPGEQDNSSSGSSAELLFMRGDSLDTVFTSSPPIQGGRRSISPGPSRHHAASANALNCPSSYYSGPGTLTTRHAQSHPSFYAAHGNGRHSSRGGMLSGYRDRDRDWDERVISSSSTSGEAGGIGDASGNGSGSGMMVSEVTGNLTRLSDSVILDIGESSSSSSSSSKMNIAGDGDVDGDDDEDDEAEDELSGAALVQAGSSTGSSSAGHNDWEVQMLAAEMERQERKRGHSLSDNLGELRHCSTFLRRRRKFSDTETEYSETDVDVDRLAASSTSTSAATAAAAAADVTDVTLAAQSGSNRPRASSLDQFNLRYGIGRGIFKAMSIDRDKDKL